MIIKNKLIKSYLDKYIDVLKGKKYNTIYYRDKDNFMPIDSVDWDEKLLCRIYYSHIAKIFYTEKEFIKHIIRMNKLKVFW